MNDKIRMDFLSKCGYSLDASRMGSGHSKGFIRIYPWNGEDEREYKGRHLRGAIDKAIKAESKRRKALK